MIGRRNDAKYYIIILMVAVWGAGCTQKQVEPLEPLDPLEVLEPVEKAVVRAPNDKYTEEDLRDALDDFQDYFTTIIVQAANQIDEQNPNEAKFRRATLMWRLRMVGACQQMLGQEEAIKSYIDIWTLCVRQQHYLLNGQGRELFGEAQPVAVEAARTLHHEIVKVGLQFAPEDLVRKADAQVEKFAENHPIEGLFAKAMVRTTQNKKGDGSSKDPLTRLLEIPMLPFQTFEGIDKGALAIHNFTATADRFTNIVANFPELIRWQLELFVLEMNQQLVVDRALGSVDQFVTSTDTFVEVLKELPEKLGKQSAELLEEIDQRQANLQITLDEAKETAAQLEKTLQQVSQSARAVEATGASVTEAGQAWAGAVREFRLTVEQFEDEDKSRSRPAATQPAEPFDITDYKNTAEALTESARELRQLTADVRGLIESRALDQRLQEIDKQLNDTITETRTQADALVDTLTWRGIILLAVAFILALIYKAVTARWGRRDNTVKVVDRS